jgi:predicted RND superfamily exporter protein
MKDFLNYEIDEMNDTQLSGCVLIGVGIFVLILFILFTTPIYITAPLFAILCLISGIILWKKGKNKKQ